MKYAFKLFYSDKKNYTTIIEQRKDFETTLRTNLHIHSSETELFFVYNEKTTQLQSEIAKNDTTIHEYFNKLPGVAQDAFLAEVISSEVVDTNELEGVSSSKSEVVETTKDILMKKPGKRSRLYSMIKTYVDLYKQNKPVPRTSKDIRKLYDEITKGEIEKASLPDGRIFRVGHSYVQKRGSLTGETIHTGIYPEEEIITAVDKLLVFLRDTRIQLLLRMAIGHYYFGYIHPFYDGNGRTSRLLSSLLIESEYHPLTAMSFARGCLLNRGDYLNAFQTTNARPSAGEMNFFVDTILEVLIAGQEDLIGNIVEKNEKLDKAADCLKVLKEQNAISEEQVSILFLLMQNEFFDSTIGLTRKQLVKYTKKTDYLINKICSDLEISGYIIVIKKRPKTYCLSPSFEWGGECRDRAE